MGRVPMGDVWTPALTSERATNSTDIVPRGRLHHVLVSLVGLRREPGGHPKPYTKAQKIEDFALKQFATSRRGITFYDLNRNGLCKNKPEAQSTLKRCRRAGILFVLGNKRPQLYYPASIKPEVIKYLSSKNAPKDPSGVNPVLKEFAQDTAYQTLIGYVLPLLPEAPLFFHNLHLWFKIMPEYYKDLNLIPQKRNYGKNCQYRMLRGLLCCMVYPNGTVDINIKCSNNPFRLESYSDIGNLFTFLGQVKERIMDLLHDPRERAIPDVMDWVLAECDINKDIHVSDAFQMASFKFQGKIRVKDFECMLRIYFKSMGPITVNRVEAGSISVGIRFGQILTGLFGTGGLNS